MIKIREAKEIREKLGLTHLVIFGMDENNKSYVATHGLTEQNAREAAKAGNKLKEHLGWPKDLTNAKPLKRKCKNCTFYKPDYGIHCFNGWSGDGSEGNCLYTQPKTHTLAEEKCGHFEPAT